MVRRSIGALGAACVFASLVGATSAHASSYDFNALVFQNFTGTNSDVEGGLAAGGKINLTGYTVGLQLSAADNSKNTLVAGQSITAGSGSLVHGNAVAPDVSGISSNFSISNGGKIADHAINFTNLQTYYNNISSNFAGKTVNGNYQNNFSTLNLTGSAAGLNVFDLKASDFNNISGLVLNIANNGFAVINVSGDSINLPNVGYSANVQGSHILFNFTDATSLTMGSFLGSILAPNANVTFDSGALNGQLIANSFNGGGQINYHLADESFNLTTPTPEASTWLMLIAGVAAIGATLRRRGRGKLAATNLLAA